MKQYTLEEEDYVYNFLNRPLKEYSISDFKIFDKYPFFKEESFRAVYVREFEIVEKKIVERVFAIRKRKNKKIEFQEIMRRLEGFELTFIRNFRLAVYGYFAIWKDTRYSSYSYYYGDTEKYNPNAPFTKACINISTWCYNDFDLSDILKYRPELKYSSWSGNGSIIDFMIAFNKCPYIEMLNKLHLSDFIYSKSICNLLNKDKAFRKWLFAHAEEIDEENINITDTLTMYRRGITYAEAQKIAAQRLFKRNNSELFKDFPMLSIDKVRQYFTEQHCYCSSYSDYLTAAKFLKLDFNDTKVLYPNEFWKYHDLYTEQMKSEQNKELDEKINLVANKYKPILKTIDDVTMLFPTKTTQFIDEGQQLHHCVGRMGYNKKMANEESLIIFIRKKEKINKSFLTLEYDPKTKRVLQFYGDHDNIPEKHYQDLIYKQWLPSIKKVAI